MRLTVEYYKARLAAFRKSDGWRWLQRNWVRDMFLFAGMGWFTGLAWAYLPVPLDLSDRGFLAPVGVLVTGTMAVLSVAYWATRSSGAKRLFGRRAWMANGALGAYDVLFFGIGLWVSIATS